MKNFYRKSIAEMVQKMENERFLRKIYIFVKTMLETESASKGDGTSTKEDKETMEEKKVFEPLATELIRDYRKSMQEEIEALNVFEEEIAKIQKQLSTLQTLIRVERRNVSDALPGVQLADKEA